MKKLKTCFIILVSLFSASSSTSLDSKLANDIISSTQEYFFSQRVTHFNPRDHRSWNQVRLLEKIFIFEIYWTYRLILLE